MKAIKIPFLTYDDPQIDIPTRLTDIARAERFAQASDPDTEETVTDAELYLYLLTKHCSADRNRDDDRLWAHLSYQLREQYPETFPRLNDHIRAYATLDTELQRRLAFTRAYLQVEKDRYYEQQLQDMAMAIFDRFGCYIDPPLLGEPDWYGGDQAET